jgi:pimeloyl-ACP methyl ester carboxylesterase
MSAGLLAKAWLTGGVRRLHVNDDDLAGRGLVEPTRLLRRVGWMPFLGGCEPYAELIQHLRNAVVHPSAVVEFPYDWRLGVDCNGKLLAERCVSVLRSHRALVTQYRYADPDLVRVVLVAHSLGGLVAQHAVHHYAAAESVRSIVTLGTPFFGSVKAVAMLAGERTQLTEHLKAPRWLDQALRELAVTCPSAYDLLPRFRCVAGAPDPDAYARGAGSGPAEAAGLTLLTDDQVQSLGGNRDLAMAARRRAKALQEAIASSTPPIVPVVGAGQPTLQSLVLANGACQFRRSLDGDEEGKQNEGGDSTVYRRAAAPAGITAIPLPQKHGALARTTDVFGIVVDKARGADTGPPLGVRPLSADIPDVAAAGDTFTVRVTDAADTVAAFMDPTKADMTDTGVGLNRRTDPTGIAVTSTSVESGVSYRWDLPRSVDGTLEFTSPIHPPGLYRVEVSGGGFFPVTDLTLVDLNPTVGGA